MTRKELLELRNELNDLDGKLFLKHQQLSNEADNLHQDRQIVCKAYYKICEELKELIIDHRPTE